MVWDSLDVCEPAGQPTSIGMLLRAGAELDWDFMVLRLAVSRPVADELRRRAVPHLEWLLVDMHNAGGPHRRDNGCGHMSEDRRPRDSMGNCDSLKRRNLEPHQCDRHIP